MSILTVVVGIITWLSRTEGWTRSNVAGLDDAKSELKRLAGKIEEVRRAFEAHKLHAAVARKDGLKKSLAAIQMAIDWLSNRVDQLILSER